MGVTIWLPVGDIEKILIASGDYRPADPSVGVAETFSCDTLTDGDGADWWRVLSVEAKAKVEKLALEAIQETDGERANYDDEQFWSE